MPEGALCIPSREWAAEYRGCKAVICLRHAVTAAPDSAEGHQLRVGVVMLIERNKEGNINKKDKEMWELVRHTEDSMGQSLMFQQRCGKVNFSAWCKSIDESSSGGLHRSKKPDMFLSRFLSNEDPTTTPRSFKISKTGADGRRKKGKRCTYIESSDWKDLKVEQDIAELLGTASFLLEKLKPFQTVQVGKDGLTCFELDKGRLNEAIQNRNSVDGTAFRGAVGDTSVSVRRSSRKRRARTSGHVGEEGLRGTQIGHLDGREEYNVGQSVDEAVAMDVCPDDDLQQHQGNPHSSSPQVEIEGAPNPRSALSAVPTHEPLREPTTDNLAAMVTPGAPNVLQNAGETQLFSGDVSSRWRADDAKNIMHGNLEKRHDFLRHLSYKLFPKFVKNAFEDYDIVFSPVHKIGNVEQLVPHDENLEQELFRHLCHLHYLLLNDIPSTQSDAVQDGFLKTFVLLDKVYNAPSQRLLTHEKLAKNTRYSALLEFLTDDA